MAKPNKNLKSKGLKRGYFAPIATRGESIWEILELVSMKKNALNSVNA